MIPKIGTCLILGLGLGSLSNLLNPGYGYFDSLWPGLAGLCLGTYFLIDMQAILHAQKISKQIHPTHWQAWLLRAAVGFALCSLIHAFYYDHLKVLYLLIFAACWCGIVFNFRLNHYRGKGPFYVGLPDVKKDSLTEKIFRNLKWKGQLIGGQVLFGIQLLGMIVAGWLYIK